MKNLLIVATALMAGTAMAQSAPVAEPAPKANAPAAAPMAKPMHDKVTSRAETVAMVREHFAKLDADKDGVVTKDEMKAHAPKIHKRIEHRMGEAPHDRMAEGPMADPGAAFDRLDTDKDGVLSREEFAKGRELRIERRIEMREAMKERVKERAKDRKEIRKHVMLHHGAGGLGAGMILMADSDSDGKITLAEAEAMALKHFDEMDVNKDGQLTPDERRQGRHMIIRKYEEKKSAS